MAEHIPTPNDAGLWALVVLARFHGIAADPNTIRHRFAADGKPFSESDLLLAARALDLKARCVVTQPARLAKLALPCIAFDKDGHHFVIAKAGDGKALIQDPRDNAPQILDIDALASRWTGRVILVASRAVLVGTMQRFDFSWFIPAVVKYRRLLLEVLGVSFAIQFFALVTPLFFQV